MLATFPLNPAQLHSDFAETLIAEGAAESDTLEFKSEPYAAGADGSREFLKDISALANTRGGWLIVGLREEGGIAAEVCPISSAACDQHQQRLESLIQSGLEPRVLGVQMRSVPVSGGAVLALRVSRSTNVPHRVTAQGSNRFYLRSSTGVYEASMLELRRLFDEAHVTRGALAHFRNRRLALIRSGEGEMPIVLGGPVLVIHVQSLAGEPVQRPDLDAASRNHMDLKPIGQVSGWTPSYNADGFINYQAGPDCHGYTQLFRSGEIEATKSSIGGDWRGVKTIPGPHIVVTVLEAVPGFVRSLTLAGIAPPFVVTMSLLNCGGYNLSTTDRNAFPFDGPIILRTSELGLPSCIVEAADEKMAESLRPAFDALWNAGGQASWPIPE